jgi:hypothetical protein
MHTKWQSCLDPWGIPSDPFFDEGFGAVLIHARMITPEWKPGNWNDVNGGMFFNYRQRLWLAFIEKQFGSKLNPPQKRLKEAQGTINREVDLWVKLYLLLKELHRLGELEAVLPDALRIQIEKVRLLQSPETLIQGYLGTRSLFSGRKNPQSHTPLHALEALINERGIALFIAGVDSLPSGVEDLLKRIQKINRYLADLNIEDNGFDAELFPVTVGIIRKARRLADENDQFRRSFYRPVHEARSALTKNFKYSLPRIVVDGKPVIARTGKKRKLKP